MNAPACPLCDSAASIIWRSTFRGRNWALARCGCGAHFTHPRPNAADIPGFYDRGYHAALLEGDGGELYNTEKFRNYIKDIAPYFPAGRALDVGCATGTMPALLRDAGYAAEGLEINPDTAAYAARTHSLPVHTGSFEAFDTANGPYDLVVMTDLVEHTEDPVQTMRKVNQLLRPGGGAYIRFPDITSLKSRYYRAVARLTGRPWLWITCQIPQHTMEFTPATARVCFSRAGFEVVAFSRAESKIDQGLRGKFAPLRWPVAPLSWPVLSRRYGTQMAFVLRKAHAA